MAEVSKLCCTGRRICHFNSAVLTLPYSSGAQTFWLVGDICLSETLRGPQELIISIKII